MTNQVPPLRRSLAILCTICTLLLAAPLVAQQPAELEDYSQTIPAEPSVIDGVWRIEATGKRILIESGHAFAMDGWVHLLLWEVQPGMRTATDIHQTGIGTFSSYDDLLKRQIFYELREDGTIRASGRGLFAPAFVLLPVELIYPEAFEEELAMLGQPRHVPLAVPAVEPPPMQATANTARPEPLMLDPEMLYPIINADGACLTQLAEEAAVQGGVLGIVECGAPALQGFLYLDGDGLLVTEGGMCLEALGDADGAEVASFGCDANDRQVWVFEEVGDAADLPQGTSFAGDFRNANGLCLTAETGTSGLVLGECAASQNQTWMLP